MSTAVATVPGGMFTKEKIIFNTELAVLFTIMWPGTYYILYKFVMTEKSPDYVRRVISIAHWFSSCILSSGLYYEQLRLKEKSIEMKFEDVAIMNALVYVVFDLVWNMYYKTETLLIILNQSVLLTTASVYAFRNVEALRRIIVEGYTIIMFTTTLVHLRYFLKFYKKGYAIVEYIFIATFLIIRAGLLTFVLQKLIRDGDLANIDKGILLANYTVGLILCINLLGYIKRKHDSDSGDGGHILRGADANPHPDSRGA